MRQLAIVLGSAVLLAGLDLALDYPALPLYRRLLHDLANAAFGAALYHSVMMRRP